MTFEEILDQATAMLQRRGRLTYGALKLQFHLDDDQLAVLKDELLYAQQVARDEAGRVLVWTGGPETLPAPPPPSTPEAERRQLTVLASPLREFS